MNRKEKVLTYLEEATKIPLLLSEIVMILDVASEDVKELEQILEELIQDGFVIKTKKKRYCAAIHMGCLRGRFVACVFKWV